MKEIKDTKKIDIANTKAKKATYKKIQAQERMSKARQKKEKKEEGKNERNKSAITTSSHSNEFEITLERTKTRKSG